jgi:GR25 family glycosyltransferase involved in LPS biosynthesis
MAPLEPLSEKSIHFYCINLKYRTDRWNAFSQQPVIQDIKKNYVFERFDAIAGSTIDIPNDPRISMRTKRNIKELSRRDHEDLNTAGGVGCYLSHVEIWKKVVTNPEPYAIIFEDDASIPANFIDIFTTEFEKINLLPSTPDMWTFSYAWNFYYNVKGRALPHNQPENIRDNWILNSCPGGTGGYFITKEGAKKLLESAFPIDMHVDFYICLCTELKKIECVSNVKVILGSLSEAGKSDIQLLTGCQICNVPTNLNGRGLSLVNIPIVTIALLAIAAYSYVSHKRRV